MPLWVLNQLRKLKVAPLKALRDVAILRRGVTCVGVGVVVVVVVVGGLVGCRYSKSARLADESARPTGQSSSSVSQQGEETASTNEASVNPNVSSTRADLSGTEVWWPEPVSVRVHPGARVVIEDGQPVLEASIELRDALGDPMKAPGQVRIEWMQIRRANMAKKRLYSWSVDLLTQKEQEAHWSPILSAYSFRLSLFNADPRQSQTQLEVFWTTPEGRVMSSVFAMRSDW